MLKKGLALLLCLVMLGMLLSGCHLLYPNGWETPTTTTEPPTITTESPLPEELLPDWKLAYLERIESDGEQTARQMYALVYVDGDDIPELYIRGGSEAEGDRVCSYKNGTLIEQGMIRCWGGSYVEKSGCFANQNGHMGRYYVEGFRLDDSGFSETFFAYYTEEYHMAGDGKGSEVEVTRTFYIEDEEVSEEDYRAAVDASFDFEGATEFEDQAVSYEDIRQQLLDYDDSSEETEPQSPEDEPLPDWKLAYLERIESDGEQTARQMYALVYVDGDDIPELYIQGCDMATGDSVCSYKNDTLIEQNMLRCWGGSYVEKSGCFANRNGSTGTYYVEVFRLDDSGFTETFCAHYGEHYRYEGDVTDEEYYERVCTFYIEDEEVSEEDYRAAVAAAFDFGGSVEFYDFAVSYDEIRYQLLGYDDHIVKDSQTDPISSAVG